MIRSSTNNGDPEHSYLPLLNALRIIKYKNNKNKNVSNDQILTASYQYKKTFPSLFEGNVSLQ